MVKCIEGVKTKLQDLAFCNRETLVYAEIQHGNPRACQRVDGGVAQTPSRRDDERVHVVVPIHGPLIGRQFTVPDPVGQYLPPRTEIIDIAADDYSIGGTTGQREYPGGFPATQQVPREPARVLEKRKIPDR